MREGDNLLFASVSCEKWQVLMSMVPTLPAEIFRPNFLKLAGESSLANESRGRIISTSFLTSHFGMNQH